MMGMKKKTDETTRQYLHRANEYTAETMDKHCKLWKWSLLIEKEKFLFAGLIMRQAR